MGICVCRKRTDLFCFLHHKPVCSSCILSHEQCLVKTYLEWLQDSDYDPPTCVGCKQLFSNTHDTLRFMCLHQLHKECVAMRASTFSSNTPINQITCPACEKALVPPPEVVEPLAVNIREQLRPLAWVHARGSIPPETVPESIHTAKPSTPTPTPTPNVPDQKVTTPQSSLTPTPPTPSAAATPPSSTTATTNLQPYYRKQLQQQQQPSQLDEDEEDKYRKRGIVDIFTGLMSGETSTTSGSASLISSVSSTTPTSLLPVSSSSSKIGAKPAKASLNVKRFVALFALFSTLATVLVIHLSLSLD